MNFNTDELNNVISFLIDLRDTCRLKENLKFISRPNIKRVSPKAGMTKISFMNPYILKEKIIPKIIKKKLIRAPKKRRIRIRGAN